ncbi:MAG: hypothetical protein LH474_07425 [Chamaesiphon sp.]|nr:hypothetical protein [Chamaesiphon sp.]
MGVKTQSAVASCNPFGCSQSSAAECNPFGCPNPPLGAACTPFGCPASSQPSPQPPAVVYPPYPYPTVGGSPQAIQQCMNSLLYTRQLVCTRESGCSRIPQEGFGGWQYDNVRTKTSDTAAAQACQNAR